MSRSYDVRNEGRGVEDELSRLGAQVELSFAKEARLLEWLGLRDGAHVLELGCGPGFVTERLLERLPSSAITALDVDPEMIARARGRLGDAGGRLRLVEASALETGLPDDGFDFVIARYLFQHLQDPPAAAREALRVLRPEGKLAVVDVDAALWGIASPASPEVQPIYAKTGRAQAMRGGDRLVGRSLWRILAAAGFQELALDAFVYHSDELGIAPFAPQISPDRLLPLVAEGVISAAELATVQRAVDRFVANPEAFVLMVGLIGSGKKPRG